MSLMWMPAQTTVAPLQVAASACGTSSPAGANRIAASSGDGGMASDGPAQAAPSARANAWERVSPGRVKANTSRP